MSELLLGFILGIVASGIAAWAVEYGSRPRFVVVKPAVWGIRRQFPRAGGGLDQAAFYHLLVKSTRQPWSPLGPRPAWACHGTIELAATSASYHVLPIDGRWSSHPEPVAPAAGPSGPILLLDPGKMLTGRRIDIHGHMPQELCVVLKYEGEDECCLFNNESYHFSRWQNPAWRFGIGVYELVVTVSSEVGRESFRFRLTNAGPSRDDVHVEDA